MRMHKITTVVVALLGSACAPSPGFGCGTGEEIDLGPGRQCAYLELGECPPELPFRSMVGDLIICSDQPLDAGTAPVDAGHPHTDAGPSIATDAGDPSCSVPGDGVACDDGDPCSTDDECASGSCTGTPIVCDEPPVDHCADDTTFVHATEAEGLCSAGVCSYQSETTTCPFGCRAERCATCAEGWSPSEVVTTEASGNVAIALDDLGGVHAVYHRSPASLTDVVEYAHRDPASGAWSTEVVYGGSLIASTMSIGVDSLGRVHVAFTNSASALSGPDGARYAWRDPVSHVWTVERVDDGGLARLTVDRDGGAHLLYSVALSSTERIRRYAHRASPADTWTIEPMALLGRPSVETSIAIDSHGGLHLGYFTELISSPPDANRSAAYAYRAPGATTWTSQIVELDVIGGTVASTSLVLDAADRVHFVYTRSPDIGPAESGPSSVRYAALDPTTGTWTIENAATEGSYGAGLSVDLDEAYVYVGYGGGRALRVAARRRTTAAWTVSRLEPDQDVRGAASLRVDAASVVHVGFLSGGPRDGSGGVSSIRYLHGCL